MTDMDRNNRKLTHGREELDQTSKQFEGNNKKMVDAINLLCRRLAEAESRLKNRVEIKMEMSLNGSDDHHFRSILRELPTMLQQAIRNKK